MKIWLFICTFFTTSLLASVEVFDIKHQRPVSYSTWIKKLPINSVIFLGEFHYNPPVQKMEAQIIHDFVTLNEVKSKFSVSWEFLNYLDQAVIESNLAQMESSDFLKSMNLVSAESYIPVVDEVKQNGGDLFGLNIDRKIKQQLIATGIESLDPKFIPPNLEIGGENYFYRFKESMGDHVPAAKLQRYFEAQCFTDSIMSYQLSLNKAAPVNFVIAGSFHTDYFDGTIARFEKLTDKPIINVKIVNVSELDEDELAKILKPSIIYGDVSDYVVMVTTSP